MQRARRRRGANLIEFALLLPVFWVLLTAVIDFGWYFAHQVILDDAVNQGCRAGALIDPGVGEASSADIVDVVEDVMGDALALSPSGPCADELCTLSVTFFGVPPSRSIRCDVNRQFEPILGVILEPHVMRSGTVARMEWQRWP